MPITSVKIENILDTNAETVQNMFVLLDSLDTRLTGIQELVFHNWGARGSEKSLVEPLNFWVMRSFFGKC